MSHKQLISAILIYLILALGSTISIALHAEESPPLSDNWQLNQLWSTQPVKELYQLPTELTDSALALLNPLLIDLHKQLIEPQHNDWRSNQQFRLQLALSALPTPLLTLPQLPGELRTSAPRELTFSSATPWHLGPLELGADAHSNHYGNSSIDHYSLNIGYQHSLSSGTKLQLESGYRTSYLEPHNHQQRRSGLKLNGPYIEARLYF